MADVTDVAFRQMFAKYGKPDVTWTEFVSCDGLIMAPEEAQEKLRIDLKYFENERPIVAQLFTGKTEMMEKAAEIVARMGFDGIDINMGCPDRAVQRQKAGAYLIKEPELAREIIEACKRGIKKAGKDIPVSVKTRIGFSKDTMEEWLTELLKAEPAVVTLHARTRTEMSKVPAKWNRIADAVKLRDELKSETLIFGNGDVLSLKDAEKKAEETGCDGVMIGRGIFGNPKVFNKKERGEMSETEKLELMLEHTKLFDKYLGKYKNFNIMKKHYKAYVNGFDGAKELRMKLMESESVADVENIVNEYLTK